MVAHIFSLAFILVIAYFSQPGSSNISKFLGYHSLVLIRKNYYLGFFSWHPFLMTLGV